MSSLTRPRAVVLTIGLLCALLAQGAPASNAAAVVIYNVGAVTWHAKKFTSQTLTIKGYVLAQSSGYLLFSDEPTGKISSHDLPVTGPGIEQMQLAKGYILVGQFVAGGLSASNGNPYHLELTAPPQQLAQ